MAVAVRIWASGFAGQLYTTGTGAEAGTVYWGDLPPRGLTIYLR